MVEEKGEGRGLGEGRARQEEAGWEPELPPQGTGSVGQDANECGSIDMETLPPRLFP